MKRKRRYVFCLLVVVILLCNIYAVAMASGLGIRDLQRGMMGYDVKLLQQKLNDLGYDISVDGNFGENTEIAVENFQEKNGLISDGIIGGKTLFYLKNSKNNLEYIVKSGDSLYMLANKYDTSIGRLQEVNELSSSTIYVGQNLIIPDTALGGGDQENPYIVIDYRVKRGDSLSKLAKSYNSDIEKLMDINNLASSRIKVGQELKIPRELEMTITNDKSTDAVNYNRSNFIWPVKNGRISSAYGRRVNPITRQSQLHGALDIALSQGTPVKAAATGKVLTSSWVSGYGRTVIIRHNNRTKTLYAHNSRLVVKRGQHVQQGQIIARSGNTGRSTGPHLHFSILINGKPVNPLKRLPHKY
ncbi:peptidoglycan DD-metalloendopeptidase family protein [Selenihalanaerobacter shriftii]|uniref:Murein DD-endopeptidase MepM and murein hydrolase activator NlpD, contain LysM domain n=1 Tax=Selenihalanaerobacter shriftii TaxID=142842 RepID=A0A1T4Q0V5_9FIRM|nr:peptidoglycan DD-metalloendopeptidase family protein [Selenihalanaerobacter shriftii]SJZ97151.1 Murein DD-endopeptidase MepM and murein hydrolase activator NlpD, contain LysM domain [Selenihalanaerobacter shriftii]